MSLLVSRPPRSYGSSSWEKEERESAGVIRVAQFKIKHGIQKVCEPQGRHREIRLTFWGFLYQGLPGRSETSESGFGGKDSLFLVGK